MTRHARHVVLIVLILLIPLCALGQQHATVEWRVTLQDLEHRLADLSSDNMVGVQAWRTDAEQYSAPRSSHSPRPTRRCRSPSRNRCRRSRPSKRCAPSWRSSQTPSTTSSDRARTRRSISATPYRSPSPCPRRHSCRAASTRPRSSGTTSSTLPRASTTCRASRRSIWPTTATRRPRWYAGSVRGARCSSTSTASPSRCPTTAMSISTAS